MRISRFFFFPIYEENTLQRGERPTVRKKRTFLLQEQGQRRIVYHGRTDYCEPARNFAIQSAAYEWVLLVDSDELVPGDLRQYLYRQIERQEDWVGLRIPRKNYLFGKFMHGDYPDYILRFFRKDKVFWPLTYMPYLSSKGK